jgi:exopolyphosphatase / guanosine-5'-triphosphate,3'-diphosphate pyrophosphatase
MPTFAAVDIGANSVRLKIARLVQQRLEVLHEDREVTRLGESVFQSGTLASDAMAHTITVLRRFHKAAQSHGANAVRVVATSSLRDARNARAFIDWVRSATGWETEVISGLEEGRLIHLAAMAKVPGATTSRVLLFDLGGGSCEVTISVKGQIEHMVSMPLGAVRLTREFLKHDPPKKKELERLREFVAEEVLRFEDRVAASKVRLVIATSGTAAALAGVYTSRKESRAVTVPRVAVEHLAADLARRNYAQRAILPGIGTRRAEIIVAGAVVFAELLGRFELPDFRFSPLGLRDGVLTQMAADYARHGKFRERLESQRRTALLDLARHYRVDVKAAEHVRELALKLYNGLAKVHQLPPEYEDWISAAAMLFEVGSYINRAGHRRHAYYIISNSEIFGYTVHQRELIGAIARYLGKSRPMPDARPLNPLTAKERELMPKAVMLLRLAQALDQGRRGAVQDVEVQIQEARVTLNLFTKRGGADLELWAINKERAYFREVFGRELFAAIS